MKLHQKLFWLLILLLPVQLGRHFWPAWSYVLGLRVDYLAPIVYLTDLLVIGILIFWFWEHVYEHSGSVLSQFRVHSRSVLGYWWVFAIFLYLLVNSLLAQNPGAAFYKFIKITEFALLGFYVAKNNYTPYTIRHPLSLAVIYSSLIAIVQFFRQASLGGIFWWLGERTFSIATPGIAKTVVSGRLLMRPYATFPHPNVLAGFLLVAIILLLGRRGIYWILVFILALIGLIISFSRSAWIVGLLCLLPSAYCLFPNKKSRSIIFGLIFLGLIGALYFAPQFSTEEALFQRIYLIKVAAEMIRSAPLAGIGLNNFIVRLPEFWIVQSIYWLQPAHNIFLLVAAETGLVGLVVFLWFLYLTVVRLYREKKFIILYSLFVILLLGLADHYWLTLQQSQLLLTIVLGLSWAKH